MEQEGLREVKMKQELKPCPFCNGTAHVIKIADTGKSCRVGCDICSSTTTVWPSEDEAIKRWNARA